MHIESKRSTVVGVHAELDRWAGKEWVKVFFLLKDHGAGPPRSVPVSEPFGWPDLGLEGGVPSTILIPDDAESGIYRIRDDASFDGEPYIEGSHTLAAQLEIIN